MRIQNDSSKSAYMLFYEKFKKNDINLVDNSKIENNIFQAPFYSIKSSIISVFNNNEQEDSNSISFLNQIFSTSFLSFTINLFKTSLLMMENPKSNIPSGFIHEFSNFVVFELFNILTKVKNEKLFYTEEGFSVLQTLISNKLIDSNSLLDDFLKDNSEKLISALLDSPSQKIRSLTKDLIKKMLEFCDKSYYVKLALLFANWVNEKSNLSWSKFTQFFETIEIIIKKGGEDVIKICKERDFLFILADFFLGKSSPFSSPEKKRNEICNQETSPDVGPLIRIISSLASLGDISQKALKCLNSIEYINRILKFSGLNEQILESIGKRCNSDLKFGKKLCRTIIRNSEAREEKLVRDYSQLLKSILSVESENSVYFCEWTIGVPDKYKEQIQVINQISNVSSIDASISYSTFVGLISEQFYPIMQIIWNYRKKLELISMLWLN